MDKKPLFPRFRWNNLFSFSLADLFASKASVPLLPILKGIIREEGPITIERYMNIVLQHPDHGYYRQGDPIGTTKDFGTAPEISQIFGEMLGVWCLDAWKKMGSPNPVILLELGPGHGTMLNDLLRFTEPVPEFHQALRIRLLESNAALRDIQKNKLKEYNPVHIDDLSQLDPLPMLFLANELFDNIPARQFIKTEQGWTEHLIALQDDRLAIVEGNEFFALPPDPFAEESLTDAKTGYIHEFSEQSRLIMKSLAAHIVRQGGAGAIIDYGYVDRPWVNTFDAWCQSRPVDDILTSPGKMDVTVDVDFGALRRVAEEEGAQVEEIVEQRDFLVSHGVGWRVKFLKEMAPEKLKQKIEKDLAILTSSTIMGTIWKVMIVRSSNPAL